MAGGYPQGPTRQGPSEGLIAGTDNGFVVVVFLYYALFFTAMATYTAGRWRSSSASDMARCTILLDEGRLQMTGYKRTQVCAVRVACRVACVCRALPASGSWQRSLCRHTYLGRSIHSNHSPGAQVGTVCYVIYHTYTPVLIALYLVLMFDTYWGCELKGQSITNCNIANPPFFLGAKNAI